MTVGRAPPLGPRERGGFGPAVAKGESEFSSGRESEPTTFRFALAMGEVVQRIGRFFYARKPSSIPAVGVVG
jgi:hypothetical protein